MHQYGRLPAVLFVILHKWSQLLFTNMYIQNSAFALSPQNLEHKSNKIMSNSTMPNVTKATRAEVDSISWLNNMLGVTHYLTLTYKRFVKFYTHL